ncbi:MAG: putative deoxyribonuclease RhsC, partial [Chlamydiae bacterium]|nr:putative deoxyribonuclease RhsC [Chlamydiota bacterium]
MNWIYNKFWLLFLLLLVGSLHATRQDPGVESVTEGDPSGTLCESVSIPTGDFIAHSEDLVIEGAFPLRIHRQYASGNGSGRRVGWDFFPHLELKAQRRKSMPSKKFKRVLLREPNGTSFIFKKQEKHSIKEGWIKFSVDFEKNGKGITNTARGPISGKTNLKNFTLFQIAEKKFLLQCPDGTERSYSLGEEVSKRRMPLFLLRSELHPDGHRTFYKYDSQNRIIEIKNTNAANKKVYAWCRFIYSGYDFDIETSDGRKLSYAFICKGKSSSKRRYFLRRIDSPEHPPESIEYTDGGHAHLIDTRSFPGGRAVRADYCYKGVKTLLQTVGENGELVATHHLTYNKEEGEPYTTTVYDSYDNKTTFSYSERFLPETIAYYQKDELHHTIRTGWSGDGELLEKVIAAPDGTPLLTGKYEYDDAGNILIEKTSGNITSRRSQDTQTTYQTYDDHNRLTKKIDPSGLTTSLSYLDKTPLVTEKVLTDGKEICIRESYKYSSDNILIEKTSDDGTARRIQRIHLSALDLPETIEEIAIDPVAEKEILINKVHLHYNDQARVIQRDIYGSDSQLYQVLKTQYDDHKRVVKEEKPLGQITSYDYDINNHLIYEKSANEKEIRRVYDAAGRLKEAIETTPEGDSRRSAYEYDHNSNKTASIDPFGNKTQYAYDAFGQVILIVHPDGSEESFTYDPLGNKSSHTDPRGHTTITNYNSLGSPLLIRYSDKTEENYTYYEDGKLRSYTNQEMVTVEYRYDALGREVAITTYDPEGRQLAEESFVYQGANLYSQKDKEGIVTTYEYDLAGRKLSVERASRRTEYTYDALGRIEIEKQINGANTLVIQYEYDLLSQLLKEVHQGLDGRTLHETSYTYDRQGNRTSATTHNTKESAIYDGFNRLICQENGEGHRTLISYNEEHINTSGQKTLCKTTTDPAGYRTQEAYDIFMHLVDKTLFNPYGQIIFREEYCYDASGNCHTQKSHTYHGADYLHTLIISKEYDAMNRVISIQEGAYTPEEKTITFTYTPTGKLHTTQKADGTLLTNSYDSLDNHTELHSSDGTIHYKYSYNLNSQLLSSRDAIQNTTTYRQLDDHGNILTETLANGLTLHNSYDSQGRRTHLRLPDDTLIEYSYDSLHLRQVTALGHAASYTYDPSGNLLYRGEATYQYDKIDRPTELITPYFMQTACYDLRGNIVEMEKEDHIQTLSYDDLSQLTAEQNHTYDYDSHYNRLSKDQKNYTSNTIHSLVAAGNTTYTYDPNGNPTTQTTPTEATHYQYDALDRLIAVTRDDLRTTFTYDSFHRRLTKTVHENDTLLLHHRYLYDGQKEIGAVTTNGEILELRILGLNERDTLLILLSGKTYLPIQDIQGNVVRLIAEDRSEHHSHFYSAFSEESPSPSPNPWR